MSRVPNRSRDGSGESRPGDGTGTGAKGRQSVERAGCARGPGHVMTGLRPQSAYGRGPQDAGSGRNGVGASHSLRNPGQGSMNTSSPWVISTQNATTSGTEASTSGTSLRSPNRAYPIIRNSDVDRMKPSGRTVNP